MSTESPTPPHKQQFLTSMRWIRPVVVILSLGFSAWFFYAVYTERTSGTSADRIDNSAEASKRLRTEVRSWFRNTFPESAARADAQYGIFEFDRAGLPLTKNEWVFLTHGLDEPGNLWVDLAPPLSEAGYRVLEFRYPNDQSIQDSSRFINDQLTDFLADPALDAPPEGIHLIGHSMGGLVLRNFITHPDLLPTCTWAAQSPVKTLIQLGTPNHGSWLATYRLPAELRDHLSKDYGKDALLAMIWDGTGQAQIDLKPGSAFLESLNQRPFPSSVYWVGVAGTGSPVDIAQLQSLPVLEGTFLSNSAGELQKTFPELFKGSGDGCVSVDSLSCEAMNEIYLVEATHRGIVRNSGDPVPPAIPIVMDVLARMAP
jgi:pimeloyl-ACP methyl ester carboxylesterase